ncbi:hydrolase [Saccharophagus sp. K07]|jgi:predicted amidohydrolase|uniref:carbon-nitrogen hydrolase family protein n=1 Tax=Saccharophagus sp. K07 TaxID=2283636 RepID=UPI001652A127|nr:carbon-nitrogen hydrolase family protein [Saccharophagus sp. K07]MBC6905788.1 hydrolase [Saccharophagus sp. K07]
MSQVIRIAAAQYPIEEPKNLAEFFAKITRWVDQAAQDSDLLVFPEYGGAEVMAVLGRELNRDLLAATRGIQSLIPEIDAHLAQLARSRGLFILAPSLPVENSAGEIQNVARFHAPSGKSEVQAKLVLTPFDREIWQLSPARTQTLFDTPFGKIGVAICYDVEFPLQVRALAEAGARLILCPSCTDTEAGYWRVRVGAMARALENQCVVVQSPTVGNVSWTNALDINRGAAGVFAPPDMAISSNGVLALGSMDRAQWLKFTVDLGRLEDIRQRGEVRTFNDWPKQMSGSVKLVELN